MISYNLTWENGVTGVCFRWMFSNNLAPPDDARIKGESNEPIPTEIDQMVGWWDHKM